VNRIAQLGTLAIGLMIGIEYGWNGTYYYASGIVACAVLYLLLHVWMSVKRGREHRAEDIWWNKTIRKPHEKPKEIHPLRIYVRIWWKALNK